MTRLEQALRWWKNNDGCPIPIPHFKALEKAGLLKFNEDEEWWELKDGKPEPRGGKAEG